MVKRLADTAPNIKKHTIKPVIIAEKRAAQEELLKVFLKAITENAWVSPTPDSVASIVEL